MSLLRKVQSLLAGALLLLLPFDGETSGGSPDAGGGAPPADDLAARAAALEAENAELRRLKEEQDARIEAEADRRLMEWLGGERTEAQIPQHHQPHHQVFDPGDGQAGGGELEEPDVREIARTVGELANAEAERNARELMNTMETLRAKYPFMDAKGIIFRLAELGDAADRVNLEKLAAASHRYEKRMRFDPYAEAYHQEKLAEIHKQTQTAPPPVPPVGSGAPVPDVKVTRENASKTLADGLRAWWNKP